jgi:hypothetical protein
MSLCCQQIKILRGETGILARWRIRENVLLHYQRSQNLQILFRLNDVMILKKSTFCASLCEIVIQAIHQFPLASRTYRPRIWIISIFCEPGSVCSRGIAKNTHQVLLKNCDSSPESAEFLLAFGFISRTDLRPREKPSEPRPFENESWFSHAIESPHMRKTE